VRVKTAASRSIKNEGRSSLKHPRLDAPTPRVMTDGIDDMDLVKGQQVDI